MNNKIIKTLIPVIAVIVIFESIMLVSSLEKNTNSVAINENSSGTVKTDMVAKEEVKFLNLNLTTEDKEMEVGKKYTVSLKMTPISDFKLNGLDLFVKFNPELVTISNLVSAKKLTVKPDFMKVSDKMSVIVENFLFTAKDGVAFVKDEESEILTFSVTPKKAGTTSFEISTGDKDGNSVTMFVDKVTSKGLPFSSNKLEVKLVN